MILFFIVTTLCKKERTRDVVVQHLLGMHATMNSSFSNTERKIWDGWDFPTIYHLTKIFI